VYRIELKLLGGVTYEMSLNDNRPYCTKHSFKDAATNLRRWGGVNALEGGREVNTVKTLKFDKGGGRMTLPPPPAPMVALPLWSSDKMKLTELQKPPHQTNKRHLN